MVHTVSSEERLQELASRIEKAAEIIEASAAISGNLSDDYLDNEDLCTVHLVLSRIGETEGYSPS